jgi:ribonuclease-3
MHKLLIFNDEKLLHRALTHRSYINENPRELGHNERLEFLGDAILTFISGEYLYQRHPDMEEGEMTRRRAALVDEKQLAQFATKVGLESRIRLGKGILRDGGSHNPNLLSSAFEALVGAYYLDHGRNIDTLRPLIEELFDSVPQGVILSRSDVDPKNKLQEFAQANGGSLPKYVTEKVGGSDHAPEFLAKAYIGGQLYGESRGRNKKEAEKAAATDALAKLKERGLV